MRQIQNFNGTLMNKQLKIFKDNEYLFQFFSLEVFFQREC